MCISCCDLWLSCRLCFWYRICWMSHPPGHTDHRSAGEYRYWFCWRPAEHDWTWKGCCQNPCADRWTECSPQPGPDSSLWYNWCRCRHNDQPHCLEHHIAQNRQKTYRDKLIGLSLEQFILINKYDQYQQDAVRKKSYAETQRDVANFTQLFSSSTISLLINTETLPDFRDRGYLFEKMILQTGFPVELVPACFRQGAFGNDSRGLHFNN